VLLAIDIGNTSISIGLFSGSELKSSWRISTRHREMADEYAVLFISLLEACGYHPSQITAAAICSGVPRVRASVVDMLRRFFNVDPLVVTSGVKTGIKIMTDNPKEVGADRIVNAVAAKNKYKRSVIVVDLGTAITLDIITAQGDYLGGVIAPGIELASDSLRERAAALPSVELIAPTRVVGKNTVDAMKSGIIYGFAELVDGLVTRVRDELGENYLAVATGGYAEIVAPLTKNITQVDPALTLEGLHLIYYLNRT